MPPSAADIRSRFLAYFTERRGHVFVPSSPVVPHDDPTLLFTNAGMNQFKDVFLGRRLPGETRVANSQKCIRAGGKHNDLEDVGRDSFHHTFFEMLGNWSFGDYFKAEAIEWAWDLLTNVWGVEKNRLHATYFAGDEADGLDADEETRRLWTEHTDIDPTHVTPWGPRDNYWEMGDTGPCGPCSEIHYDGTPDASGASLLNAGSPAVIEIWNLVFIQHDRGADGRLTSLPDRHIDTGMGFERLVRILQGGASNYDTDLWTPIFEAIRSESGARAYGASLEDPLDTAYRVVADHARCLVVALTDGARPDSEGRGFVLRRILRRAVRIAHQSLDVDGPLLHRIVPAVVESLGDAFPELHRDPETVAGVIRDEEERFGRTLDRGLLLFETAADEAEAVGDTIIGGKSAFTLHDTYGFPIDLTQVIALERGMTVDLDGYERRMEGARRRSRAGGETGALGPGPEAHAGLQAIPPTDLAPVDEGGSVDAVVRAIWMDEAMADAAGTGAEVGVLLDRTSFYAEQGGQVGDAGVLLFGGEVVFEIHDAQRVGASVLHLGTVLGGGLRVGDAVTAHPDEARRDRIRANHTGTHLLNHALRCVLGDEVHQRGSLVADDRLRFDFSHGHALTDEELEAVEGRVNDHVAPDLEVAAGELPLEVAMAIHGMRAVFGERYPDPVRVVSVGASIEALATDPAREDWHAYSTELCGGTHGRSTGLVGRLSIIHEQALAAGVRRVTALTGEASVQAEAAGRDLTSHAEDAGAMDDEALPWAVDTITAGLETRPVPQVARHRIEALLSPLRDRLKAIRRVHAGGARDRVVEAARAIAERSEGPIIVELLPGGSKEHMLPALDVVRARRPGSAILLVASDETESRVSIVAGVAAPLIEGGLKAGDWVREAAGACGGSGGGRPDTAQAGGRECDRVHEAIETARTYAERMLT